MSGSLHEAALAHTATAGASTHRLQQIRIVRQRCCRRAHTGRRCGACRDRRAGDTFALHQTVRRMRPGANARRSSGRGGRGGRTAAGDQAAAAGRRDDVVGGRSRRATDCCSGAADCDQSSARARSNHVAHRVPVARAGSRHRRRSAQPPQRLCFCRAARATLGWPWVFATLPGAALTRGRLPRSVLLARHELTLSHGQLGGHSLGLGALTCFGRTRDNDRPSAVSVLGVLAHHLARLHPLHSHELSAVGRNGVQGNGSRVAGTHGAAGSRSGS